MLMADELAALEDLVRASGPLLKDRDGLPVPNPAAQQHRLLTLALGRVLAGIRVVGDQDELDGGVRPQRRSGFRGPYTLKAVE